jgi:hypothetical protein
LRRVLRLSAREAIDLVDIELLRVEVASAPFEQFVMALMLWVCDGLQELVIAPQPPTRTPPGAFAEPGIGAAWAHRRDCFQRRNAAPAIAVVIEILEDTLAFPGNRTSIEESAR